MSEQFGSLKYKCLILDHDDTCVDSTAVIHYPAHLEVMRQIRPNLKPISLETWFEKNFHPGIMNFLTDELNFNPEEVRLEYEIWRNFTESLVPDFFPGIIPLLTEYRRRGGFITVVSHSDVDIIKNFYLTSAPEAVPDLIFGWNDDPEKRKPHPWPAQQILKTFGLEPGEILLVDDLRPGIEMAKIVGVPAAAAGWSHRIPIIEQYMRENCIAYLESVNALGGLLF